MGGDGAVGVEGVVMVVAEGEGDDGSGLEGRRNEWLGKGITGAVVEGIDQSGVTEEDGSVAREDPEVPKGALDVFDVEG